MKTFFIAFILGVFTGALVTAYINRPEAFEELMEAKTRLSETPSLAEPEAPEPQIEEDLIEQEIEEAIERQASTADPRADADLPPASSLTPPPIPAPEPPEENREEQPPRAAPPPRVEPPPEEEEADEPPLPETAQQESTSETTESSETAPELAQDTEPAASQNDEKPEPYLLEGVDLAIATAIRAQYKLEEEFSSDAISIEISNRAVLLRGAVPSNEAKRRAIEIAVNTKGVSQVTADDLLVE